MQESYGQGTLIVGLFFFCITCRKYSIFLQDTHCDSNHGCRIHTAVSPLQGTQYQCCWIHSITVAGYIASLLQDTQY